MPRNIDYSDLSNTERLLLAQELIGSVAAQELAGILTPEQMKELDRSFLAVQRGEEATYSWEQVQAELRSRQ